MRAGKSRTAKPLGAPFSKIPRAPALVPLRLQPLGAPFSEVPRAPALVPFALGRAHQVALVLALLARCARYWIGAFGEYNSVARTGLPFHSCAVCW